MKTNLIILLFLTILLGSCSNDESSPAPYASFFFVAEQDERDNFVFEVHDTLTFDNRSNKATAFLWDFGDGTTSTLETPKHKYVAQGSYSVSLTAFNADELTSVDEKQIQIGGRSFRNLVINKISSFKPDGTSWDPHTPPDLLFYFGEIGNPNSEFIISFAPNIQLAEVPFGGNVKFDETVFLTDADWFFILLDNDSPMNTLDANDERIFEATLNPVKAGIKNLPSRFGRFDLIEGLDNEGEPTSEYEIAIAWDFMVQ